MSVTLELQAQLTCPNCWASLHPADLFWVSSHADLRGDPYLGEEALKRFLPSRFDVEGFALDAKGMRCQALACPRCHLLIPRILTEIRPVFVSVLGAPSSGKSYFLAASVWETRKKLRSFHVTFTDADPVANQIVSAYEQKLFLNERPDQIVAIPKTEQEGELYQLVDYKDRQELYARPFVFAMRPTASHVHLREEASVRRESRALCLYDNAGEHFQPTSDSELSPATDHLALSEVSIFVFDPLQHPKFRKLCREYSDDPQLRDDFRVYRQDTILLEAAKRIRQKANIPSHERFKKPLVVAVNKYDVWAKLLPNVDLLRLDPYVRLEDGAHALNRTALEEISDQVEGLLEQTSPEVVAACRSFSDDVLYLPVSPQGCSPERVEGNHLGVRPDDIRPIWAEVPLLYAICRSKCSLVPAARRTGGAGLGGSIDGRGDRRDGPQIFTGTG